MIGIAASAAIAFVPPVGMGVDVVLAVRVGVGDRVAVGVTGAVVRLDGLLTVLLVTGLAAGNAEVVWGERPDRGIATARTRIRPSTPSARIFGVLTPGVALTN